MEDLELKRRIDRLLIAGCRKLDTEQHPSEYFPGEPEAAAEEEAEAWADMKQYLAQLVKGK